MSLCGFKLLTCNIMCEIHFMLMYEVCQYDHSLKQNGCSLGLVVLNRFMSLQILCFNPPMVQSNLMRQSTCILLYAVSVPSFIPCGFSTLPCLHIMNILLPMYSGPPSKYLKYPSSSVKCACQCP